MIDDVVLRDMAIITSGVLPVRTVEPGSVVWSHYVAVDTGLWRVGKVASGIGYVKRITS